MRALVMAAVLLAHGGVAAAEKVHTVAAGESAASLAKEYYGDRERGDLLLRFNGKAGKMLHPGEKLSIPLCTVHRARPGETWSTLSKRYLGRAGSAPVLAELNGSSAGEPLRVGARIVVPVVLRHTLARGESLSSLAQRFYGDPNKAAMLQEFGRIEDAKRVAVGTALEIPLVAFVPVKPAPAPAPAPTPAPTPAPIIVETVRPPPTPAPRRFEGELVAAGRVFLEGEYDRAREMLEALRAGVTGEGSPEDRREWARMLAFTYIALDRDDDACAAFRSGASEVPPAAFDPDLVSPRIRSALSKCAGASSGLEPLDNPGPPPQIPPHAGT